MKVLVLNGSPKGEKSDTMHITRAFTAGMNDVSENEIHTIHVIERHIEYCTGCLGCMRNGGDCVHHDDMRDILEEILDSDVLLFSFPLYCYGMPAPLKALIDRTLPLSSIAMICGCSFPNRENNFEPAVIQFQRMFRGDSTIITVPEAPMFNAAEAEAVTRPFLEVVRQAGREYATGGVITADTSEKLHTPMIPHEIYAQIVNGSAK